LRHTFVFEKYVFGVFLLPCREISKNARKKYGGGGGGFGVVFGFFFQQGELKNTTKVFLKKSMSKTFYKKVDGGGGLFSSCLFPFRAPFIAFFLSFLCMGGIKNNT
jgi:hypothetical protein